MEFIGKAIAIDCVLFLKPTEELDFFASCGRFLRVYQYSLFMMKKSRLKHIKCPYLMYIDEKENNIIAITKGGRHL